MNLYRISLADLIAEDIDFLITISAGSKEYQCHFLWDIATQEQYDNLVKEIAMLSATDPLVTGDEYVRDYNWVEYYITHFEGLSDSEIIEWVSSSTSIPQSLRNKSSYQITVIVKENLEKAQAYAEQLVEYNELLRWQCTVTCEDVKTTTIVQPGGWYNYDSGNAFRFISGDHTYVGLNDLQYVSMEFDIDE